jgi:hypothetical protein
VSAKTGDPVTPRAETPTPEVKAEPVVEAKTQETPKPTAEENKSSSGKAEDILAMIRARQSK